VISGSERGARSGCPGVRSGRKEVKSMGEFKVEELTLEELSAIPDLLTELAAGCGWFACGACHDPT